MMMYRYMYNDEPISNAVMISIGVCKLLKYDFCSTVERGTFNHNHPFIIGQWCFTISNNCWYEISIKSILPLKKLSERLLV